MIVYSIKLQRLLGASNDDTCLFSPVWNEERGLFGSRFPDIFSLVFNHGQSEMLSHMCMYYSTTHAVQGPVHYYLDRFNSTGVVDCNMTSTAYILPTLESSRVPPWHFFPSYRNHSKNFQYNCTLSEYTVSTP